MLQICGYNAKIHYLLTYLLTPWCRVLLEKLTGLQLVKKFPAFLWNSKVHHRTHKRPPPVPILGQPNPVHIPTSHLLKIHPNIIHPSKIHILIKILVKMFEISSILAQGATVDSGTNPRVHLQGDGCVYSYGRVFYMHHCKQS